MKKITLALALIVLLLSGCKKEATDKNEVKKEEASLVETKTEQKENKKEEAEKLPVKDSSGNAVTSENLADMIDKANDENTDEATKREILDEIDYILKQAEKNAQ